MVGQFLRSKFPGSLVGTGVGDAIGASFEGWYEVNLEEIQAMIGRRKVLTYTDDTHMVIGVAESFNSVPTAIYSFLVHPDSFAEAFLYAISLGVDTDWRTGCI